MKRFYQITISLIAVLFLCNLLSCSSDEKDYSVLEQELSANEELYASTFDFNTRMNICDNAISTIDIFLTNHPTGEWSKIAETAKGKWGARLTETTRVKQKLLGKLHETLKQLSEEAAKKKHPLSKIEECVPTATNEEVQGQNLCLTDSFDIRMKGNIIGRSIFKLTATVSGCINIESETVQDVSEVKLTE